MTFRPESRLKSRSIRRADEYRTCGARFSSASAIPTVLHRQRPLSVTLRRLPRAPSTAIRWDTSTSTWARSSNVLSPTSSPSSKNTFRFPQPADSRPVRDRSDWAPAAFWCPNPRTSGHIGRHPIANRRLFVPERPRFAIRRSAVRARLAPSHGCLLGGYADSPAASRASARPA